MNNQIERFSFQGDELSVARTEDGDVAVPLRRLCEVIGVDYAGQYTKLKNATWAAVEMISMTAPDGKNYETVCLHRRSIPLWAASINANKVREEVRAKLAAYQTQAAEVLADHFIGPRVTSAPAQPPLPTRPVVGDKLDRALAEIDRLELEGAYDRDTARAHRLRLYQELDGIDLITAPAPVVLGRVGAVEPLMLGTGGAVILPVVDTAGTRNATEIGRAYHLTAQEVGRIADATGVRPSILRGETAYGVRVRAAVNGQAVGAYQARYSEAGVGAMHAALVALVAEKTAEREARTAKQQARQAKVNGVGGAA